MSNIPAYAEIGITTNFSFLRGGSHPGDYVHQASELRIPVIGLADHNTLALPDPEEPVTHVWAESDSDIDARRLAQEYARRIRQLLR